MNSNEPISEQYRLAGEAWCDADAAADLLENTKSAFLSQEMQRYGAIAVNKAEQMVKASPAWTDYIEKMVNARKRANILKVRMEYLRMKYWEHSSVEATKRQEMRL